MERKTITVCIILAVLGIAAAIAGFAAESTKVKRSQLTVVYVGYIPNCEHPNSPAMGLAIVAAVAIVLARAVITSATGGCCSCCRSISLPILARICIVISWITSLVAIFLFIQGARLSSLKGVEIGIDGEYHCYTVRPGIFLGAGIMGLVSVLLAIVYYLNYVSAKQGATKTSEVDLELEVPPTADGKKPPITNAMKPPVLMQKH
ncbi:protein modifying wall lignin-1 [Tanacetum coccineum]